MNMRKTHLAFVKVCRGWQDYRKGKMGVDIYGCDCSNGCKFFIDMAGGIGDWGVCICRESPRSGLLTWEHMGCGFFVKGKGWNE